MTGFEIYSTEILEQVRENLLQGLGKAANALDNGTFYEVGPKGEASPSQSAHLTLTLLEQIETVLAEREHANA